MYLLLVYNTYQYLFYISENFKDFQNFVFNNFGPIYDTKLLCKEVKRIVSTNGLLSLLNYKVQTVLLFF